MGYLLALYPGEQVFYPFPTTTTSSGTFRFITRSDYLAYYTALPVCRLCWLLLLLLCSYSSSYSHPITTNRRLFVFVFTSYFIQFTTLRVIPFWFLSSKLIPRATRTTGTQDSTTGRNLESDQRLGEEWNGMG